MAKQTVMDVGRVCVKNAGREAGKKCVIVEVVDKNFVVVAGPGVKKRRCNITHLEPTVKRVVKIKKGASAKEIEAAVKD
jgi:large subunit ribosomal protein L14e